METKEILHILRNPNGFSDVEMLKARTAAADRLEQMEKIDSEKQNYFFTFTQSSELSNYYVVIYDTYGNARDRMCNIFGAKWAFQYNWHENAGIDEYNLKLLISL